jgi:N-formylmaleamate deformylase
MCGFWTMDFIRPHQNGSGLTPGEALKVSRTSSSTIYTEREEMERFMDNWKSGEVTANGIKLHYTRTGGDKPPVVAAHGLTDNGLCWSPVAEVLAADYELILIDARGHGRSEAPAQGYSSADHAADYAGAIQALALDQPALIGHSMGAATSAYLAAHYPGLVRGIILEDPPWRSRERAQPPLESLTRAREWRQQILSRKGMTAAQLIEQRRRELPVWPEAELGPWAEAKLQVSPQVIDYVEFPSPHWSEFVAQIACPALLIIGDEAQGAIVSPQTAAEVVALNPRVEVAHIPGAGHSIRREQFAPYVDAVRGFLQKLS